MHYHALLDTGNVNYCTNSHGKKPKTDDFWLHKSWDTNLGTVFGLCIYDMLHLKFSKQNGWMNFGGDKYQIFGLVKWMDRPTGWYHYSLHGWFGVLIKMHELHKMLY